MTVSEAEIYLESKGMYRITNGEYQLGIPRYVDTGYLGVTWVGLDYKITEEDIQAIERYKEES